ncbi:carbohydrate ABC transporter permease [Microbacterium sp. cx-55]|uniref:carbohydrate ABC transporter permease n=1 Tax=unclassified Microbacterium TaxID=2609290 RepID=UPI001CC19931|nr:MULTISPECIES: carbohydrate ABC transporter permease [unclassified Microbacterium]MBZ4487016.1 carbohydrate ABC transporter permease [Microbacterium sp. cx-55]MCC4907919.1 carbohydrate ABC transporter permease [Microbacterium sp. cx-59]UGB35935.1 carbohydrate ABC transporter permease [Microbacterium sp. cx-55]
MSENRRVRAGTNPRSILATVVLVVLLVFFVTPLIYLVSVSLMGRNETGQGVLIPAAAQWTNWTDVLVDSDLLQGIGNSLVAAIGGAVLTIALAVPGAWAIVRYRTGGRTLSATLMSPWLLPPIVAVVPLFTLLRVLGLNNTLLGLTLVYALVNVPVGIWLLEGFLRKIPEEIEEAARIDGAGSFRILFSIVVPIVTPAMVAVGIIVGVLNYNEFLLATFLTQSPDAQTLPVVLSLFYGERTPHFGKIAAASVMGVIPVFAAAVFLQRWLIGGLTSGSVR